MLTCVSHLQGASASLRRFTLISPPARLSSRGFLAAHVRVAHMRLCCTCRHAEGSRLAVLQVPLLNVHAVRNDGLLPAVLPAELCCGPASACVGMHLHAGCRCDGVAFSIEFSAILWKLTMQIALQNTECVAADRQVHVPALRRSHDGHFQVVKCSRETCSQCDTTARDDLPSRFLGTCRRGWAAW